MQVETGGGLFHGLTTSPSMSMRQVVPIWRLGGDYVLHGGVHLGLQYHLGR